MANFRLVNSYVQFFKSQNHIMPYIFNKIANTYKFFYLRYIFVLL